MRAPILAAFASLALLAAAAPAAAQTSTLPDAAEIEAAIEAQRAAADADRAAVGRILESGAGARAAAAAGVDLEQAKQAARLLEGEALARAGALARAAEAQLAGGQTMTINATTLIIILLLVIIVVLIAD